MGLSSPLWRDSNQYPVQVGGVTNRKSQTLSGNNTTVATPIFRITGTIELIKLFSVVTTTLGANVTAAYYRLNDQSAQVNITLNTGTTISALTAGSFLYKKLVSTSALTAVSNANGAVTEQGSSATNDFTPAMLTKKAGANTDIEFVYSTTDTPTSGVIQHFLTWLPASSDAAVVAQ